MSTVLVQVRVGIFPGCNLVAFEWGETYLGLVELLETSLVSMDEHYENIELD